MSTETPESVLKTLRERVAAAATRKARAQAEYERAERDREEALAALREFGVETPEQAAAVLKDLEASLATALADVEKSLTEAGA